MSRAGLMTQSKVKGQLGACLEKLKSECSQGGALYISAQEEHLFVSDILMAVGRFQAVERQVSIDSSTLVFIRDRLDKKISARDDFNDLVRDAIGSCDRLIELNEQAQRSKAAAIPIPTPSVKVLPSSDPKLTAHSIFSDVLDVGPQHQKRILGLEGEDRSKRLRLGAEESASTLEIKP